jgi:hypothetical protein
VGEIEDEVRGDKTAAGAAAGGAAADTFMPSSSSFNSTAPVAGTFHTLRYLPGGYDEKLMRRAAAPDKLQPLVPQKGHGKTWVS